MSVSQQDYNELEGEYDRVTQMYGREHKAGLAWCAEIQRLKSERDQLRAKLHDMTADRDEWKRTYKDVPPDIMSTSMPLPLDPSDEDATPVCARYEAHP